jgi:hypothetical protein
MSGSLIPQVTARFARPNVRFTHSAGDGALRAAGCLGSLIPQVTTRFARPVESGSSPAAVE